MKKFVRSFALLFFLPAAIHAQTQFWSDTFEDVGAPSSGSRTPSTTFNASNERYFDRVTTAQVNTTLALSGFEGSKFWGAADVDNLSGQNTQSPHQNVTWSSINISGRSGLSFKGLFATGTNNNFDHFPGSSTIDYMIVEYRIDGGPWTSLVRFFPNTANSGSAALALETTGDSLAQGEGAALDGTFTEFSANITGTGTLLDLRFKCESNGTSFEEEFADNFRLFEAPACVNPTITSQPPNRSICNGSNTTFNIAATGATAYQWQVNTGSGFNNVSNVAPYSGVTTATLSITGATPAMSGYLYRCIASDASCNTTSSSGTLTVSNPVLSPNSQLNVSCFGGSNGSATVSPASGGISPYTYNWTPGNPTGDGTISVSGLTAGSWTCTVTDNIGCTATATFNITAPTAINVTAASQTNVSCNGGSNGAASINTPTGGAGGYTYNWTPGNPTGDGTTSVTGLTAGSWTCTVTDANSCTASQTFNITAPTAISVTAASQTNVSCNGGSNGAASINTPTGGAGGYTYNWTPGNPTGDGTTSVTGLTAGSWTCTVTDANSCTASQTFNITAPTAISVTAASQTNVSCNGGSNGAASINTPTGGAGGYTYNWTPGNPTGDGTVSVTGLTAGSWTCTVTDANSCTASQTFNITAPTAITANISSTATSCTGNTGTATVSSVSGGAGGYTYSWAPTGGNSASATGLGANTYSCTITDANTCTLTKTVVVSTASGPSLTVASQTNVTCNGGSNGAASVNAATGGTGPYTYNWTPGNPTGDGTTSVTGLTAGSWTCTVTDANSCTASATFNITQPAALVVSATASPAIICSGNSSTLSASGATTYMWMPGSLTGAGVTVSPSATTTYTVTGTTGSCTANATVTVTVNPTPTVAVTSSASTICDGASTTLSASGATSYDWMPGSLTGTSITVTPSATTTYTVTGTSGTCSGMATLTVTVNPTPSITASASPAAVCDGGSSTLTAADASVIPPYCQPTYSTGTVFGDYVSSVICNTLNSPSAGAPSPFYTLFPASGNTTTTLVAGNTYTISLVLGTYTNNDVAAFIDYNQNGILNDSGEKLGETDDMGATPASTSFTFTVPANALNGTTRLRVREMDHSGTNDIDPCIVQSSYGETEDYIITITGGVDALTFAWSPATFLSSTTGASVNATLVNATTTYTVTGTSMNGCSTTATTTLTVNPLPTVTATAASGTVCDGTSETLTAAGANTYSWSSGGTAATETVTPSATSTYTVTGTDANGCDNTATVTVTVNALPNVTASAVTGTICDGSSDTLVAAGASSYVWDNSATTDTIVVMPNTATTYTVTGTDGNGCTNTATATVNVNALPNVTAMAVAGTICDGSSDTLVAGGALSYAWDNSAATDTTVVMPNTTTTFTVTGTDANGCSNTATATVNVNALPNVTATAAMGTICAGGSDTLVAGGASSYVWDNAATTDTIAVMPAMTMTYSVTGADANGCLNTGTVTVTVNALPLVALGTDTTLCGGPLMLDAGNAGSAYMWSDSTTAQTFTATASGTYYVGVTDMNGCMGSDTIMVTINAIPSVNATAASSSVCVDDASVALTGTPTGGTWSGPGVTGSSFSPSGAGVGAQTVIYSYTDSLGCTGTASAGIQVNACVGIAEATVTGGVSVYPNPNNGTFTLMLHTGEAADVMIYDALGQLVSVQKVQPDVQQEINITRSGVYMITVVTADGQRFSQRVIVQK